jgi:truncated hemoglobin YjbI
MDTLDLEPDDDAQLWAYMVMAAHSMVNTPDTP